ncbi:MULTISPECIES: MobV family relaxase [Pseudoalteromonas]|uniref:MobV family relaxase n=1 Tax=Pseudoalteromonas TaxID=53246 RepID=UPI0012B82B20|nr:MobV family relaxase [Pseudoalteromonas elyakovii]
MSNSSSQLSIEGQMYQIVRVQKLKSMVSIQRSVKHSFRTQTTPNADPEKERENNVIGLKKGAKSKSELEEQAMQKLKDRMPTKLRKNGVLCVEHLVTASPEFFDKKSREEQNEYFIKSLQFFKKKWGEKNVIFGGIHRDETTPHMYLYVVPLDEKTGRLNCRKWLGERDALNKLQTNFHKDVAQEFGLDRGLEGSKAQHQTLKKYYAKLNDIELRNESEKPTAGDYLKEVSGLSNKVESLLDRKNTEINTLIEKNQLLEGERGRFVKAVEWGESKNKELNIKYKDPISEREKVEYLHKEAVEMERLATLAVNRMPNLQNENEALKIALRSAQEKSLSYQNQFFNLKDQVEQEENINQQNNLASNNKRGLSD